MRKLIASVTSLALVASFFAMVVTVDAAPPDTAPGKNKIECFESGAADCTLNSKGAKGSATLTVTGEGIAAVIFRGFNDSLYAAPLGDITHLAFSYSGDPALAGSPRLSIPVDTTGDGLTDFFASVSAFHCNDGAGRVDPINDPTCTIHRNDMPLESHENWAAFVAAYPTAQVSFDENFVFVGADDVGTWTVSNVVIGKPGK